MNNDYDEDYGEEEPSLEEMAIDDSISLLSRLKKYVASDLFLHRLFVVKELTEAVVEAGVDASFAEIIPILADLVDDPEPLIRRTLLEQLPQIAEYFLLQGGPQGYDHVRDTLLQFVLQLLTDDSEEVRAAAQQAMLSFMRHMTKEDLEACICPVLEKLASEDMEEEYRTEAVEILCECVPLLGLDLCRSFAVPLLERLGEDPVFRVRKICATCCGPMCEAVAPDPCYERVLRLHRQLCGDDIWGVRKACVESLVQISESVPNDVRRSELTDLFCQLASDPSRWVRTEAYKTLGWFISTFAAADGTLEGEAAPGEPTSAKAAAAGANTGAGGDDARSDTTVESIAGDSAPATTAEASADDLAAELAQIHISKEGEVFEETLEAQDAPAANLPQELLELYLGMVDPGSARSLDVEIVYYCAFYFPAVLLVVGADRWADLSTLYHDLATDIQWKVRRSLAFSIHEVARIVGPGVTESELVPIFNSFLKDLDEVKIGVLRNLSSFVERCTLETRQTYLHQLEEISSVENVNNWRSRAMLAAQISELCAVYPSSDISEYLGKLALRLALDDVASVREYAYVALGAALRALGDNGDSALQEEMCKTIIDDFASSERSFTRQSFARLCRHVARDCDSRTFARFQGPLLGLKDDRVANVRITLALSLADIVCLEAYADNADINECLRAMQSDPDRDVASCARERRPLNAALELPSLD